MTIAFLLLLAALPLQQAPDLAGEGASEQALVDRIRDNLTRIDEELLEAADAVEPAEALAAVRERQLQVVRDLEELIKKARYRPSGQGGGSSQQQPQSSSGQPQGQPPPRDSDGSRSPQPDQEQPSSPQEEGGRRPEDGQDPQDASAQPDGSRPESGEAGRPDAGQNEQADGQPPPDPLAEFTREDADGRWGLLPPKLQERLVNLHVDDIPERYRSWLEAYIRAMHRLEQEEALGR